MEVKRGGCLLDKFLEVVCREKLWAPGEKIIVALSGGADSLALTDLILNLPRDLQPRLHLAHLNHRLRGRESEADADYVREIAGQLGLPVTIASINPLKISRLQGYSPEDAARRVRYRFLAAVAATEGAKKIALGHHMDDQAETLLLHLFRGSGLDGLTGMKVQTIWDRLVLLRPLLEFRRRDIYRYCLSRGYNPRTDSSNYSLKYTRNRIRQRLIPFLEQDFNNRIVESLGRTARVLQRDWEYLESVTDAKWQEVLVKESSKTVELNKQKLLEIPAALRARLWRRAVATLIRGAPVNLGEKHINTLNDIFTLETGSLCRLPGGLAAGVERDRVVFYFPDSADRISSYCREMQVPGETALPDTNVVVRAEVIPRTEINRLQQGKATALLDYRQLSLPLMVRNRRPGDYFRPLGMEGKGMKLKEFFSGRKIPARYRDLFPLVISGEEIAWVGGLEISELFKVKQDTSLVLRLEIIKSKEDEDWPVQE